MLRIIDANLNRLGEGLRVLEDIARFVLNDCRLTEELRCLRRELTKIEDLDAAKLLESRDVPGDVGIEEAARGRPSLIAMVRANARRSQEALRVLEECSRLPEVQWEESKFQGARFRLYELERELVLKLSRQQRRERVRGLYLVLDSEFLKGRGEIEAAEKAIRGGVRIIQLRDKHREKRELLDLALRLRELCAQGGALFIVNDHLDIALSCEADGLHIGQKDLPLTEARRYLPQSKIIGVSAHNLEEALQAESQGCDYIAVGSIYPTGTKESAVVVGLEVLRQIRQAVGLPIVAIGGINRENAAAVMSAGAQAIAVVSAVLGAADIESAVRDLIQVIESKEER